MRLQANLSRCADGNAYHAKTSRGKKIFAFPIDLYALSVYHEDMKRKPGGFVPAESAILEVALDLQRQGSTEFHGYQVAKVIEARGEKSYLTGYGTLYRALERLEKQGYLTSYWEERSGGAGQKPPRRRLYRLTGKPAPVPLKNAAHDCVPANWVWEKTTL